MDQATGDQIAAELGLTPQRLQILRSRPSFEEALLDLDELKKEAKSRYKKLAFKHHPDRNPGDPQAVTKFTQLGEVMKTIEGLKLQRAVPPPVMHVQFVQVHTQPIYVRTAPSYSGTTTSTTTTYVASRVVNVRPV